MAYHGGSFGNESGGSGNVWSSGSRGGSRGGYSRSNNDDADDNSPRGGGSYRGSYGNNYSNRGGYGFRRQDDNDNRDVEIQKDTIFIQNLPKDITKDAIHDAFSGVGQVKIDDRSGGPKIWIYKDRITGEANGRATVTYEDNDSANRAISEYNDKHIDSIDAVVQVQLAQRRPRNNDRGGFSGGRGYRGGRSSWDSNNSRQGSDGGGNRWGNSNREFSDNRSGNSGFRGRGGGGNFSRDDDDRDGSFRGNRGGSSYRGASRGNSGSSNYSPY